MRGIGRTVARPTTTGAADPAAPAEQTVSEACALSGADYSGYLKAVQADPSSFDGAQFGIRAEAIMTAVTTIGEQCADG